MMNNLLAQKNRRKNRVRARVSGTAVRPRLTVSITNKHIIAQVIDDTAAKTLAYVTTVKADAKGTMTEKAEWVGVQIAEAAKKHKVNKVVFDRAGRLYHGRLHALAEAARKAGLEF
jgi:large subunit ribosomal protein L18